VNNLWVSTASSINCAFVRLSTSVGLDKVIDMAHKMGISKQNLDKVLTLTLGVFPQNTETMADVIATVASGGVHHTPYVVQRVVFPDGKVVEQNNAGDQALTADVANCEQNVLRGVVTGGTGTGADVAGQQIFGKTGTTDNTTDAWFIGANPGGAGQQLATAVWFGNVNNAGGAGFGGSSAAPVFQAFMSQALAGQAAAPLPDPGPVCARAGESVIDTGGRDANAPVGPVTPQLPTVQQVPTTPNTPTPTTPQATTPVTTPITVPNTRPNGKP
jgi:penicillin-binding protein 1A